MLFLDPPANIAPSGTQRGRGCGRGRGRGRGSTTPAAQHAIGALPIPNPPNPTDHNTGNIHSKHVSIFDICSLVHNIIAVPGHHSGSGNPNVASGSPDLFSPEESSAPQCLHIPSFLTAPTAQEFPRPLSPSSEIDIEVSPTTSDLEEANHPPQNTRSHRPSPPRAGPHSILAAQTARNISGPAGNRSGHAASDVWSFINKETRVCMLCE